MLQSAAVFGPEDMRLRAMPSAKEVCCAGFVLIAGAIFVFGFNLHSHKATTELLSIYESLSLSMNYDDIPDQVSLARLVRVDDKSTGIVIYKTPTTIGARNWILVALIVEQRLAGYGIRCDDSVHLQPSNAPADVVDPSFQTLWVNSFGPVQSASPKMNAETETGTGPVD